MKKLFLLLIAVQCILLCSCSNSNSGPDVVEGETSTSGSIPDITKAGTITATSVDSIRTEDALKYISWKYDKEFEFADIDFTEDTGYVDEENTWYVTPVNDLKRSHWKVRVDYTPEGKYKDNYVAWYNWDMVKSSINGAIWLEMKEYGDSYVYVTPLPPKVVCETNPTIETDLDVYIRSEGFELVLYVVSGGNKEYSKLVSNILDNIGRLRADFTCTAYIMNSDITRADVQNMMKLYMEGINYIPDEADYFDRGIFVYDNLFGEQSREWDSGTGYIEEKPRQETTTESQSEGDTIKESVQRTTEATGRLTWDVDFRKLACDIMMRREVPNGYASEDLINMAEYEWFSNGAIDGVVDYSYGSPELRLVKVIFTYEDGSTKSSIYEFIIEDAMMMDIRYADELN